MYVCVCEFECTLGLLPPSQSPIAPCRVHVDGEGAVCASVCGHGGGGVCARGVFPASQPVGGTGRWAPRGGCEGRGTLPSDPGRKNRGKRHAVSLVSVPFGLHLYLKMQQTGNKNIFECNYIPSTLSSVVPGSVQDFGDWGRNLHLSEDWDIRVYSATDGQREKQRLRNRKTEGGE